jgi:putative FmdB family regulatory protein
MPLYEYQCQPHHHRFEARQGINDEPLQTCPECGGPVRRVIHPVGIVFKGSGFYATDSRKGAASGSDSAKTADKGSKESTSEPKTETKAEGSKAEAKSEPKAS